MKIKSTQLVVILLIICSRAFSQGVDINSIREKFFVSLNLNPSLNNISLTNGYDKQTDIAEQIMVNPSLTCDYMFSSKLGLRTGIGFSFFRRSLSLDSTAKNIDATDSDNDLYKLTVSGKGLSEKNKVLKIDIPVGIVFTQPVSGKMGFYIIPGAILSVPAYSNYNGSGSYSFEAYYPKYNLTLKDIPEHGLYTNKVIEGSKKPDIVSLIFSGGVEAGLSYKVKRDFSVLFGFHYFQSLNNILKSQNDGLTPPTLPYSSVPEYKSILESNKEAVLKSYGIQISLKYLIR